jgi:hypothetical protein
MTQLGRVLPQHGADTSSFTMAEPLSPKADLHDGSEGLSAAVGNVLFLDNHTDLDEQFHGQPIVRFGPRIDHGEHL